MRKIEVQAKTTELAIEKGLQMLGATMEQVSVEVLEKESMLKRAKIEMTLYESEEEMQQAKAAKVGQKQTLKRIKKVKIERKPQVARTQLTPLEESIINDLTNFLNSLMQVLNVEGRVSHKVLDDDIYMIMEGAGLGVLIGHHGSTLEATQILINGITKNKYDGYRKKVFLDIENYRHKRMLTLQGLAKRMATKVVQNRRSLKLEPMNSFERRVIHSTLQEIPNITTHSEGVEPRRYLVIDYKPN